MRIKLFGHHSIALTCIVLLPGALVSCTKDTNILNAVASYKYTCNHFIDAETGNDANTGKSVSDAWATFDRAAEYSRDTGFSPFDAICLKRGQRFIVTNGNLGLGSSGASGYQFVTYGAYGDVSLPKPRLSTALKIDDISEWPQHVSKIITSPKDWEPVSGTTVPTWRWPNVHGSWDPSGFWEDNKWLKEAPSSALSEAGQWYYEDQDVVVENNGLYYSPLDGNAPGTHDLYFAKKYSVMRMNQASDLLIMDLTFEYSGRAIGGGVLAAGNTGPAIAMREIGIVNNDFNYIENAIEIQSEVIDGVKHENHDLAFINNNFSDVRFGMHLHSSNTSAGFRNILIDGNKVSNISVNGDYVSVAGDIEAISLQNARDIVISNNDVRNGLKKSDGVIPDKGSTGIVIWRHPTVTLSNVSIESNFVSSVSNGIAIGAGPDDAMRNIAVVNNIVTSSEVGLKLNGTSSVDSYVAAFNTLHQNDDNIFSSPINGQVIVGNISSEPGINHIKTDAKNGSSVVDFNGYFPDGMFTIVGSSGNSDQPLASLAEWQSHAIAADPGSLSFVSAGFASLVPVEPEDFKLTQVSVALDKVGYTLPALTQDHGGQSRLTGQAADMGAWERQSDGI